MCCCCLLLSWLFPMSFVVLHPRTRIYFEKMARLCALAHQLAPEMLPELRKHTVPWCIQLYSTNSWKIEGEGETSGFHWTSGPGGSILRCSHRNSEYHCLYSLYKSMGWPCGWLCGHWTWWPRFLEIVWSLQPAENPYPTRQDQWQFDIVKLSKRFCTNLWFWQGTFFCWGQVAGD